MSDLVVDLICREVFLEEEIERGVKRPECREEPVNQEDGDREKQVVEVMTVPRSLMTGKAKRRKLEKQEVEGVEGYEDPVHTILPVELRRMVLQHFTLPELLLLRRVSTSWRATIDTSLQVKVKIDGESPEFKGRCSLPMNVCTLISLQNPAHRHLFHGDHQPENVRIDRGICAMNFAEMLWNWSSLTVLELSWRTTMKNYLFDRKTVGRLGDKSSTWLQSLKTLSLEILSNDHLGDRTQSRIAQNLNNLCSMQYPSLESLRVVYVGYRELHVHHRHMSTILPFISRHSTTLSSLTFTLKYASHVVYPPVHPRHILFCVPCNLKTNYAASQCNFEGHLVTTHLSRLNTSLTDQWEELLTSSRALELAITTRFISWTIKHLDFFRPTITSFAPFLRRLDIMNVTMYDSGSHETVTQLDGRVFTACHQLTDLRFYRAPIIFHEEETEPPSELVNLHHLPRSLQTLLIDGLPVSSVELLATVTLLNNLSAFHYFQSPVPQRNNLWTNGVNCDVLSGLVKHPTLIDIKVHVSQFGQIASRHSNLEKHLVDVATSHGWKFDGLFPGYMNLYQVTLSKSNCR